MVDQLVDGGAQFSKLFDRVGIDFLEQLVYEPVVVDHPLDEFAEVLDYILIVEEDAEEEAIVEDGGVVLNAEGVVLDALHDLHVEVPAPFLHFLPQPVCLFEPVSDLVVDVDVHAQPLLVLLPGLFPH